MLDDSINIRGVKRYAVDHIGYVLSEPYAKSTGKRIAIVGGGPGGLSATYYLQRVSHQTIVYEKRKSPGGMLRYGIPSYRLPRARLDEEIEVMKAAGMEIHADVDIGKSIAMCDLGRELDAIYLAIGVQTDRKVDIPGEDGENVTSAVMMLRRIGDDIMSGFKGKRVLIIDGGSVAMNVAGSSKRPGIAYVGITYRRRQEDMTALPQEVEGALAEDRGLLSLQAPTRIELDGEQKAAALWIQSQMISSYCKRHPSPKQMDTEEKRILCGIIVMVIGQGTGSQHFAREGVPIRYGAIDALNYSGVENMKGILAGGNCVTGLATAIRAIAVGKVAVANVDEYLGYHHAIECDITIPAANYADCLKCGHIQLKERQTTIRNADFGPIEYSISSEEVQQECERCLRRDHYGFDAPKGGRTTKW